MRLHTTDAIRKPASRRFHEMMTKEGAFPEVKYKEGNGWAQYSLIPYTTVWARFMKCVDAFVKAEIDPELGIFTRKHSAATLQKLDNILANITEEMVISTPERFQTWVD